MDEVESQFNLAEAFLTEARVKVEAARIISNLPQYIDQRLVHLIGDIERMSNIKRSVETVRKDIPDGAIEAELESGKHGKTQTMM